VVRSIEPLIVTAAKRPLARLSMRVEISLF
jgi:hypothetical protein